MSAFLGCTITPEDDRVRGARPVAVLSYDFWLSRYGGDRGAIGRTIRIHGHSFTIIGVTPPSFFGVNAGISQSIRVPWAMATVLKPASGGWNPFDEVGPNFQHSEMYQLFGRLKPGVSMQQAQASLEPLLPVSGAITPIRLCGTGRTQRAPKAIVEDFSTEGSHSARSVAALRD